ncbi:hypothetical protein PQR66_11545 [Paraburkholderia agricolaris]|uniref:Transmembrane transcriptional regulator (Anti-sigma factor RsiW) n=1 Tax=Paraburkholderia agricolaris TaxID=2152888 RepID=A0ABW8ZNL2_9BURK
MIDRDDERMLSLLRGELTGRDLDALLDEAERAPAVARRLTDWQRLATLAVDEHVEATRESMFAALQLRLSAGDNSRTAGDDKAVASSSKVARGGAPASHGGWAASPREAQSARTVWLARARSAWRQWLFGASPGMGGLRRALAAFMLALVFAQAGVIGWMVHDRGLAQSDASTAYRGSGDPCKQAVVSLAPGATVDALVQWLGLHNATMQGPDENGRFTILASDPGALRDLLADSDASRLVAARQPNPVACGASH